MKQKNIVWILMMAVLASYCSADMGVLLVTDFNETVSVDDIIVIEDNAYYQEFFVKDFDYQVSDYFVRTYASDGKIIANKPIDFYFQSMISYDPDIFELAIVEGGVDIYRQEISFCNDNGICEPCEGPGCLVAENVLTCLDCKNNSFDKFCEVNNDGICDPDCVAQYDCLECDVDCLFEESIDLVSCPLANGVLCFQSSYCDGAIVDSSEQYGDCCVNGSCVDFATYQESIGEDDIEKFNYGPYVLIGFIIVVSVVLIVLIIKLNMVAKYE